MRDERQLRTGTNDDPTVIGGRYVLHEVVGRGGAGEVYRATHTGIEEKEFAVKLLRAALAAGSDAEEVHRRFFREATVTGKIDHPNVLSATDAGVDRGRPFIITTFLEGEDLRKRLRRLGP